MESHAIWSYAKPVRELEHMVERMILQSMGLEKYYDSLTESLAYVLRLSEYGAAPDQESNLALQEHLDHNMITIVCQYQMDGLEVTTRDGEWIRVVSQPNSFNVMLGEAYQLCGYQDGQPTHIIHYLSSRAWSNGRLQPPLHRVRLQGACNQTRCSLIFGSKPKEDTIIQAPKELIDEGNPLRFRPFKYDDFVQFRHSEEGKKCKDAALQAFAGVEGA